MADETVWGKPAVVLAAPSDVVLDGAGVGPALDLAFPGAPGAELKAGCGAFSSTQVFAVRVPITLPKGKRLVGFAQTLQFGYQKTNGARVVLLAELAGVARVVEFGYDAQTVQPIDEPIVNELVFSVLGLEGGNPSLVGLQGDLPDYTAVFTVVLERRTLQESALFSLDRVMVGANIV
jgi:hypothetical protein